MKTISTFTFKGKRFFATTDGKRVLIYDSKFGFYGGYRDTFSFKRYYEAEGDSLFIEYKTSIH